MKKILVICTTDSMIWNFLVPHIEKLIENGFHVECVCSRTGFYFEELEKNYNLKISEIPFVRNPFKAKNIKSFFKLKKIVKENKYDIVMCHEPVGGMMGRLCCLRSKAKVIYTAHGFHFYKGAPLKNWLLYYPVEKTLSNFTDVLLTLNEEDYQLSKKFHAKQCFKINGIGIDFKEIHNTIVNKQEKRKELGISDNVFIVLNAAELIPRKNHEVAIRAFAKADIENSCFIICGSGDLLEELKTLVKELKIEEKVLFLGFRKDIKELYQMANLFLFPSKQEGLSVSLMEAMASSLPIVCSNIRGNIDLIVDNKGGFLYDVNDVDGYAKGIAKVYSDVENHLGQFNSIIVKKYDLSSVVDFIVEIVKGV